MQTIRWYRLFVLGMLLVPAASRAQAPAVKGPQPKITETATIPGVSVLELVKMPNGHVVVYTAGDSVLAYDMTTKRSSLITRGYYSFGLAISPRGNRVAYQRATEDEKGFMVWSIAVDPASGKPLGTAQRVSAGTGDSFSFSPDGQQLVYLADRGGPGNDMGHPNTGQDLVLIPAQGGSERVLAHYVWSPRLTGVWQTSWSGDGKWIYHQMETDSMISMVRVPVGGGKTETLFTYTHHPRNGQVSGLDGQLAFWTDYGTDRMGFQTAGGTRGEFAMPAGAWFGNWNGPPTTLRSTTRQTFLHLLDLETGKIRDVPVTGENARFPVLSPDNKRLAVVTGTWNNPERAVLNTDGSGTRHFPILAGDLKGGVICWSPDGSGLVIAADSGRTLRLLNLDTGSSRVIASEPAPGSFSGDPVWLPDGRSFRIIISTTRDLKSPHYVVVEFGLNGARHVIRDLSAAFPSLRGATLTSNLQAVVQLGDSMRDPKKRFVLVQLADGATRSMAMAALEPGVLPWAGAPGAHSDKWFLTWLLKGNETMALQVMSTGTESTRVLHVPGFTTESRAVSPLLIDEKHLVAFTQTREHDFNVYSVPLDGSAPRVLARIPDPRANFGPSTIGLSLDRKLFAFFSAGPPISHIYDVDLTPILNLIKKP